MMLASKAVVFLNFAIASMHSASNPSIASTRAENSQLNSLLILTSSFGKAEPAVGFVLDLDALTDVLHARAKDLPSARRPQPKETETMNDHSFADSSGDLSALFLRVLERRDKDERVSLGLAGNTAE